MSNVVIYPLGFLGFDIGLQVKEGTSNLDNITAAIRYNRPIPKQESIISNHDVQTLWKQYNGGFKFVTDHDFREKILLTAIRAFGTNDFFEWCELQKQSPFFTDMHRTFILDTLDFISGKQKRKIAIHSWPMLIQKREVTTEDRDIGFSIAKYFDNSRGQGLGDAPLQPWMEVDNFAPLERELPSVIWSWVSKDNGFNDLLMSLHILFGDMSSQP